MIRPYTGDPLSACCGKPEDCDQRRLYCFNRLTKEADLTAMHAYEKEQELAKAMLSRGAFDDVTGPQPSDKHILPLPKMPPLPEDRYVTPLSDLHRSAINYPVSAETQAAISASKVGDVIFDKAFAAAQEAINEATHGSVEAKLSLEPGSVNWYGEPPPVQETAMERPAHYSMFPIEPMTFVMVNDLPAWTMHPIKYICRAPHKHDDETIDLYKAIRCIEMRIEQLKREKDGTIGNVIRRPL